MYYKRYAFRNILNEPRYVIVDCRDFGYGTPGWRLDEVAFFAFAKDYTDAKALIEHAHMFRGGGMYFMIKYENWLSKGGKRWNKNAEYNTWYCIEMYG